MDEVLLRQLTRQLKILNIWISIVGVTILAAITISIYLLVKVITFVQNTSDKITNLQQKTESSLNVKQQVCDSKSLSSLLQDRSTLCK